LPAAAVDGPARGASPDPGRRQLGASGVPPVSTSRPAAGADATLVLALDSMVSRLRYDLAIPEKVETRYKNFGL
jgi:hypothetical protein